MSNIKELIDSILSSSKLNDEEGKVYRDEPIIKTASQMSNYLPPKYREMRALAKGDNAYMMTDARLFVLQGRFMADFEDDFDYHGEFIRYFPTYRAMNDLQLRSYFSWRTKLRKGIVEKAPTSFAFVYIYELLNLIGVSSPEEGFEKLRKFRVDYGAIDRSINPYLAEWLRDFVVYRNLNKDLFESISDSAFDSSLAVLAKWADYSEDELFSAMLCLSSYNIENSRFYKENSNDVKHIICTSFSQLSEYFLKSRKYSLCENWFGHIVDGPYYMFRSAIFCDEQKYENYEFIINDTLKFTCRNGNWRCTRFIGKREKNRELGAMIKAVDCVMRQKYGYSHEIKPPKATKTLIKIIEKEADLLLEEKEKNERPKIEIDVSVLQNIRRDSIETRDKLIVDEEETEEETVCEAPAPPSKTPLNDAEYKIMQCLLYGGDFNAACRESGMLLSVVVDSINEKLFDLFGDTAIVFDGDTPEVLEDYEEELKGLINI